MDPRLLRYYNQELRYLREMGAEFGREFPKIASRLGIEGLEVADPYVERLLEGSAFLAARVQLKLDAEFPQLAQRLLDMVCPNLSAPIPSMMVTQLQPKADPGLLKGYVLPRGTALMGPATSVSSTRCEFRTGQDVTLTPVTVTSAEYFINASDLSLSSLPLKERPRGGVRIRLSLPAGVSFSQLEVDSLRFYLGGLPDVAFRLQEQVLGTCCGVLVGPPGRAGEGVRQWLDPDAVVAAGYEDDEALLPVTQRGLSGTRLMQEYFAFPQRFMFFDVKRLSDGFAACPGNECELVLLFSRQGHGLEGVVEAANFALHCVPSVNLFPRRADRVQVNDSSFEFHVVPERAAPVDFEVHALTAVDGVTQNNEQVPFYPLFATPHSAPPGHQAYWSAVREPRLPSDKVRREGARSGYVGSEVFISLVNAREAPYPETLRQLSLQVTCTNRDLPVFMPVGGGSGMSLEAAAPVDAVTVVAGPSRPLSTLRDGSAAWQLLNLLSLNYLSMVDTDAEQGAQAMRELLHLFAMACDPATKRQIEGLRSVRVKPVVRRHPVPGPIAFGRGLEVQLTVDELSFEGGSAFVFGSVLHRYLSRHVSMNSFVQTSLISLTRGEIMRWRPEIGARPVL
ncbi:MAG: type VI secretion system baseplate subunit TssF [Rubrivivax sp.]|nr:MAG: type VI secretion system baseplate subunit TssF [Rubrivivax sp.]